MENDRGWHTPEGQALWMLAVLLRDSFKPDGQEDWDSELLAYWFRTLVVNHEPILGHCPTDEEIWARADDCASIPQELWDDDNPDFRLDDEALEYLKEQEPFIV